MQEGLAQSDLRDCMSRMTNVMACKKMNTLSCQEVAREQGLMLFVISQSNQTTTFVLKMTNKTPKRSSLNGYQALVCLKLFFLIWKQKTNPQGQETFEIGFLVLRFWYSVHKKFGSSAKNTSTSLDRTGLLNQLLNTLGGRVLHSCVCGLLLQHQRAQFVMNKAPHSLVNTTKRKTRANGGYQRSKKRITTGGKGKEPQKK